MGNLTIKKNVKIGTINLNDLSAKYPAYKAFKIEAGAQVGAIVYNGQTYTALLRCRVCHQENFVEYCGYFTDNTKTYFFVEHISCTACGSDTNIDKNYHISDLDENRIVISPYASLMAMELFPEEVYDNIQKFKTG